MQHPDLYSLDTSNSLFPRCDKEKCLVLANCPQGLGRWGRGNKTILVESVWSKGSLLTSPGWVVPGSPDPGLCPGLCAVATLDFFQISLTMTWTFPFGSFYFCSSALTSLPPAHPSAHTCLPFTQLTLLLALRRGGTSVKVLVAPRLGWSRVHAPMAPRLVPDGTLHSGGGCASFVQPRSPWRSRLWKRHQSRAAAVLLGPDSQGSAQSGACGTCSVCLIISE